MTKPGRLPCVNPACRRTAPTEQFGESDIICRHCFKMLPVAISARYRQLHRRVKKLNKLIERRVMSGDNITIAKLDWFEDRTCEEIAHNWQLMRDYFRISKKPLGLEGFLQEMGL